MDSQKRGKVNKNLQTFFKSENLIEILKNFEEVRRQILTKNGENFMQLKVSKERTF